MTIIKSGAGSDQLTVDTGKAAYSRLRDSNAADALKVDKAAIVPATIQGLPILGADYKIGRAVRAMSDGSLADGSPTLLWSDTVEGAAVNTNLQVQTTTTMTITQATGVTTYNAGSSVATTVGAAQMSQRSFVLPSRGRVLWRSRQRHTAHFNNNLIELGLLNIAAPSATTTLQVQLASGAVWQKDGTGQYIPSLFINGALTVGTAISNATFVAAVAATDYAIFEVELDEMGASFRIVTTAGVLVSEQRIDFPVGTGDWTCTHFNAYTRTYNSAGAGTAVQILAAESAVYQLDTNAGKPWSHIQAATEMSALRSPTAFTTLTAFANNAAPTARTPTNTTAAGEVGLGGICSWSNGANSFGASDTLDLIIFDYQIPVPYNFMLTGIHLQSVNMGAANGAAIYTIEWGLSLGLSALSLATAGTYPGARLALGFETIANAAAIGAAPTTPPIDLRPGTPWFVPAGRYVHVFARVIGASAATGSQVIRTACTIDGYFE